MENSCQIRGRGPTVVAVSGVFLFIILVTVILRIYVRKRILKVFGMVDWLVISTLVMFVFVTALWAIATCHGYGQHIYSIKPPSNLIAITKAMTAIIPCYFLSSMFIKLTIALQLLHFIKDDRTLRWIIYLTLVGYEICTLIVMVIATISCVPISFIWERYEGATNGVCVNPDLLARVPLVYSAFLCFTDVVFAIVPCILARRLISASFQKKALVAIILGLGWIASIATLVRIRYTFDTMFNQDITWNSVNFMLWSIIELGLCVFVSNAATFRPLVTKCQDYWNRMRPKQQVSDDGQRAEPAVMPANLTFPKYAEA